MTHTNNAYQLDFRLVGSLALAGIGLYILPIDAAAPVVKAAKPRALVTPKSSPINIPSANQKDESIALISPIHHTRRSRIKNIRFG